MRLLVLCLVLLRIAMALMPPHPDLLNDKDFQKELAHRRRLREAHAYLNQTQLIHPDVCRYVDRTTCLQADEFTSRQAEQTQYLIKSKGKLKTLVLLVQFTNHQDRQLPSRENITGMLNGKGVHPELYPTGSVREYLKVTSFGQLDVDFVVALDWTLTDNTESHYSFNKSGVSPDLIRAFDPLLNKLDGNLNWDEYDQDGDGYIDSLLIMHSGFPAERGRGKPCGESNSKQRIWSHAIGWVRNEPWTSRDGRISVGTYMITSALRSVCGTEMATILTTSHEIFHTWKIPDLYDRSTTGGKGLGFFDVMGYPYKGDQGGTLPGFLSAWSRLQLEWTDPVVIKRNGKYQLPAVATSNVVYKIDEGFPEGEYLLIENRQPILWDRKLFTGGILIWHVDDKQRSQRNRGYPGQEGWPGNGNHYQIALLQADGRYDLEVGENHGDETDFFIQGSADLKPGPGVALATDASLYPNTDSYQNGNITKTNIRIFDFSPSAEIMTFQVEGLLPALPTISPAPTQVPTTLSPTGFPSTWSPTNAPSVLPTQLPTTAMPTREPVPTVMPTTATPTTTTTRRPHQPRPTDIPIYRPTTPPTNSTSTGSGSGFDNGGGGANIGLAIGLSLLFLFLALVVGYIVWRRYYKKNPQFMAAGRRTAKIVETSHGGDDMSSMEEGGVEIAVGVEVHSNNDDDKEEDCEAKGQDSSVSTDPSSSTNATPPRAARPPWAGFFIPSGFARPSVVKEYLRTKRRHRLKAPEPIHNSEEGHDVIETMDPSASAMSDVAEPAAPPRTARLPWAGFAIPTNMKSWYREMKSKHRQPQPPIESLDKHQNAKEPWYSSVVQSINGDDDEIVVASKEEFDSMSFAEIKNNAVLEDSAHNGSVFNSSSDGNPGPGKSGEQTSDDGANVPWYASLSYNETDDQSEGAPSSVLQNNNTETHETETREEAGESQGNKQLTSDGANVPWYASLSYDETDADARPSNGAPISVKGKDHAEANQKETQGEAGQSEGKGDQHAASEDATRYPSLSYDETDGQSSGNHLREVAPSSVIQNDTMQTKATSTQEEVEVESSGNVVTGKEKTITSGPDEESISNSCSSAEPKSSLRPNEPQVELANKVDRVESATDLWYASLECDDAANDSVDSIHSNFDASAMEEEETRHVQNEGDDQDKVKDTAENDNDDILVDTEKGSESNSSCHDELSEDVAIFRPSSTGSNQSTATSVTGSDTTNLPKEKEEILSQDFSFEM